MNIRNFIKYHVLNPILDDPITQLPLNKHSACSYSQLGEDLVIDALLHKDKGFYVDVGANDPVELSNTKRFYDKGWSGIVIEPNPLLLNKFYNERPLDIPWNCGIGTEVGILPFYVVSGGTLSSFSKSDAERGCRLNNEQIVDIIEVNVRKLNDLPLPDHIDFMSIDTEGNELDVLKSHNWEVPPDVIVVEIQNNTFAIYDFLTDKGYDLVYKNQINGIFYKRTRLPVVHDHSHDWRGMPCPKFY